jgi:hypothetical protein
LHLGRGLQRIATDALVGRVRSLPRDIDHLNAEMLSRARLALTETRFYTELAPQLNGLPTSYGSVFDPLTGGFVLVLEDLAVDHCEFPDTLRGWRARNRPRRALGPLPSGRTVCVRGSADHRWDGRHAGGGHRFGGSAAGSRRSRRPRHGVVLQKSL